MRVSFCVFRALVNFHGLERRSQYAAQRFQESPKTGPGVIKDAHVFPLQTTLNVIIRTKCRQWNWRGHVLYLDQNRKHCTSITSELFQGEH